MMRFVALTLLVIGCGQTDSTPLSNARHAPAPGSIFFYKHWYTFADTAAIGPDTSTDIVTARGVTYEGKNNVLVFSLSSETEASPEYINYESNGDMSEYVGAPANWERIPLSSHDTVVCIKGKNSLGNLVVDTNSFIEAKDTTIEGHFWHAIKIRQIVSLDGHTFNNEVLWYDAETGWYLRMDMPPRHPFEAGLPNNGEEVHVYDCKIVP